MKWINLGLPSGTLWAAENEEGYYTFDETVEKFGDQLPTKEDFEELFRNCWKRWDNERKGLEFMGNNGEKVFFPALGYRYGLGINDVRYGGYYWSATPKDSSYAYCIYFYHDVSDLSHYNYYYGQSVRLIKKGGEQ